MEDSMEKILVTSDGMSAHTILPRSYCYIIMTAQTPAGTPVELFKAVGGEGTFDVNFTDPMQYAPVVDSLYEQLMQKREGVYADAGRKTVILGGMMTGMLSHEAVGHTVEADLVLGGSVAGHMLNKRVGSDLVTMTDFANTAFGKRCPSWNGASARWRRISTIPSRRRISSTRRRWTPMWRSTAPT